MDLIDEQQDSYYNNTFGKKNKFQIDVEDVDDQYNDDKFYNLDAQSYRSSYVPKNDYMFTGRNKNNKWTPQK